MSSDRIIGKVDTVIFFRDNLRGHRALSDSSILCQNLSFMEITTEYSP